MKFSFGIFPRIVCLYLCLAALVIFLSCRSKESSDLHSYSKWMTRPEFNEFLKKQETEGKGKWADALEGKWENGYQKFRIAITKAPEGKPYSWLFSYDIDQKTFQAQLTENSINGYRLVHSGKSTSPSGVDCYTAVWHK